MIENFDRSVNFYKSLSERVEAFSEPGGNVLSLDIIEAVEVLHQEQVRIHVSPPCLHTDTI